MLPDPRWMDDGSRKDIDFQKESDATAEETGLELRQG
jgi:hypothetical protein